MSAENKKIKYTVFLIKDEYSELELKEVIEKDKWEHNVKIKDKYEINGVIYVGHNEENEPSWYKVLQEGIVDAPELFNKSTRAVMLVKRRGRIFAFTYGHGRSMILSESIERGFGMRVVLNNCEVNKLKSIDSSTIDTVTIQARTQTSRSSEINNFQIDDNRDLLKAVTAESIDFDRYGKVIAGRDSFHFTHYFSFEKLNQVCDQLLEDYESERYKENFEWIDHLNEVRDPDVNSILNEHLINQLNDIYFHNNEYNLHIAPPEIMDTEEGIEFAFNNGSRKNELVLEDYMQEKKPQESYNIEKLKRDKVYVYNASDELLDQWSVYNCFITELEFEGNHYVLSFGQWYLIDKDYISRVNQEIENIDTCSLELIDYDSNTHSSENEYNEAAADYNKDLLCMDRENVYIENGKFEFCDLLSTENHLIHVKPWSSSSTLSHLFAQGKISAESLMNIPGVVQKINERIYDRGGGEEFYLNADQIYPQDYTVVYGIIYEGDKQIHDRIPFFSKLNLLQSVRTLKNMQFNVEKMHIKKDG